jgi:hypothetical protein
MGMGRTKVGRRIKDFWKGGRLGVVIVIMVIIVIMVVEFSGCQGSVH